MKSVLATVILERNQFPVDEVVGQNEEMLIDNVIDVNASGLLIKIGALVNTIVLRLILQAPQHFVPD